MGLEVWTGRYRLDPGKSQERGWRRPRRQPSHQQVDHRLHPFGGSDATGLALDALGPPPSNEFGVRGVKVNKKGSAKLTIKVAGPGELELAKTGSVKGQRKRAAQSGKAKLTVKAKRKAKKRLNKRGKTTVKAKVTYTPDGGASDTKSKTIKLVKR